MSVMNSSRLTIRCPDLAMPNSAACFSALEVSAPALASATTLAPEL